MAVTAAPKKKIKSDSDIEYWILESPSTGSYSFDLEFEHSMEASIPSDKNISKLGSIVVKASEIRDKLLPLDPDSGANPREPTQAGKKSGVVSSMQDTLTNEKEKFILRNGGITIVCSDFKISNNKLTVTYSEDEGIVNGGHTYFSIVTMPMTSQIDAALVRIELISLNPTLIGGARKNIIVDCAISRNRNRAIDNKSSANSLGYFDSWKKALGVSQKHINWKEGDRKYSKQGIQAEEFIRIMTVFDLKQYRHRQYNTSSFKLHRHATGAGPGKIHDEWFESTDMKKDHLGHIIHLAMDIMKLRDTISEDFNDSKWKGQVLPIRWTDNPTMAPLNSEQLWGSEFGNWIKYGSVKPKKSEKTMDLNFLPNGGKGIKLPVTLMSILLGQFRDCVWAKHTVASKGKISLIGWYVNPIELWKNSGLDIMGAMKHKWNNVKDTIQYRKEEDIYKIWAMDWGGKKRVEDSPEWFFDLQNNKKYVKENTSPTHHVKIHPRDPKIAKLENSPPPAGVQGYILG